MTIDSHEATEADDRRRDVQRRRRSWMLGVFLVCLIASGTLSWALLLGMMAGNKWATVGFVYGVAVSGMLVAGTAVRDFDNEKRERNRPR